MSFHRHGREVSPVMDNETSKLIIPAGKYVTVNAVALSRQHPIEAISDTASATISEGYWTIPDPRPLRRTTSNFDWPPGCKVYFITNQIVFEDGYELWIIADSETKEPHIWFYLDDWNVRPVVDEDHSLIEFPSANRGL